MIFTFLAWRLVEIVRFVVEFLQRIARFQLSRLSLNGCEDLSTGLERLLQFSVCLV